MNIEDLSIIICGKFNLASLSQIEYYKSIAKQVIISCWDTDDTTLMKNYNLDGVNVIKSRANPNGIGPGTLYYQVNSANAAIQKVHTKYTIKTRMDESFGDLNYLIKMIDENKNKIIFGNPHFDYILPYHAGDHFYGCKTKTMRAAFYILKKQIEKKFPNNDVFNCDKYVAIDRIEQYITRALLYCNGERDFSKESWKKVLLRNCDVCPIQLLGDVHYTSTWSLGTIFMRSGTVRDGFEQTVGFKTMDIFKQEEI